MRHGGKILADQLGLQGVRAVFTVPGESFLAALDGLHDSGGIETIICRQEGGAAMMADAWAKATGETGICFVTRGPGLANAMSGLHIAQQDSSPVVLFLGLPASDTEDREAFQEVETKSLLGTFVKWVGVIRETERIPEYVSRAFHVANPDGRAPWCLVCQKTCWRRWPMSKMPSRYASPIPTRLLRLSPTYRRHLPVPSSR